MGFESGLMNEISKRKAKRAKDWLKQRGINPHVGEEHVRVEGLFGADTYDDGSVRIGASWAWSEGVYRHELFHRAHILRQFAPRPKDRKNLKRGKHGPFPTPFAVLSEMGAVIAEHRRASPKKLKDTAKIASSRGIVAAASARYAYEKIVSAKKILEKMGAKNADEKILRAIYESKTLTDLENNLETLKDLAELEKTGMKVGLREILAAKQLARWKKWSGGRRT